jgi:N-acetylglutamate synthase-like GNAT family acetyltransferase
MWRDRKGDGMGRSVTTNELKRQADGEAITACSLRLESADDLATMQRIFRASRRATLDESGFDESTVERLTAYQYDLERADFGMSHPQARWEAIVVGGDVVGRLVTHEDGDRTILIDVVIDPLRRRQGTGSAVMTELIARAENRPIELHVARDSAADTWFRRFGFVPVDGDAPRRRLVREPDVEAVEGTAA